MSACEFHGAMVAGGDARGLCPLCQKAEIERLTADFNDCNTERARWRQEAERLRAALRPFVEYYNLNDCDRWPEDDCLEIPLENLRRARRALGEEK